VRKVSIIIYDEELDVKVQGDMDFKMLDSMEDKHRIDLLRAVFLRLNTELENKIKEKRIN
jgi:hypothetical protein